MHDWWWITDDPAACTTTTSFSPLSSSFFSTQAVLRSRLLQTVRESPGNVFTEKNHSQQLRLECSTFSSTSKDLDHYTKSVIALQLQIWSQNWFRFQLVQTKSGSRRNRCLCSLPAARLHARSEAQRGWQCKGFFTVIESLRKNRVSKNKNQQLRLEPSTYISSVKDFDHCTKCVIALQLKCWSYRSFGVNEASKFSVFERIVSKVLNSLLASELRTLPDVRNFHQCWWHTWPKRLVVDSSCRYILFRIIVMHLFEVSPDSKPKPEKESFSCRLHVLGVQTLLLPLTALERLLKSKS